MKPIPTLAALVAIIAAVLGSYLFLDTRFAKCAELKSIERRLDYKIENDILNLQQDRLWKLEDRYGSDPDKVQIPEVKQQMKEIKAGVAIQQDRLRSLEAK